MTSIISRGNSMKHKKPKINLDVDDLIVILSPIASLTIILLALLL